MLRISGIDKFAKHILIAILILIPVASIAGGLAIAPLTFILGLVGLILHSQAKGLSLKNSPTFILLMMFLMWICITSLWSPYRPDDLLTNYIKLFIMGGVFYFCPAVFKQISQSDALRLTRIFLATTLLAAICVAIDVWSNFKITFFFHPASSPEDLGYRMRDAEMNLGHAITVLVLFFAPVTFLLKTQFRNWKFLTLAFLSLIIISSYSNDLWIGVLGSLFVSVTMLFALRFPRHTPVMLLVLSVLLIMFAPLLAFISSQVVESNLGKIPLSWEHRIRMWGYCWSVILENPIIGDGFDAARTYTAQWTARDGRDLTIVSLHPHNVGIHIWTETGLIGALMASSVLSSLLKPIKAYAQTPERSAVVSGVLSASLLISSTTYGAWQFWWWGSIFLSAGLIYLMPMAKTSINKVIDK